MAGPRSPEALPSQRAMVRIPVTHGPLMTSSLSHGFFEKVQWPEEMTENARRLWCRVLAQVIGPLRKHLRDTECPLVAPGSAAEMALEETKQPLEDLTNRMTMLEVFVTKKLEQFETSWVTAAEAISELELTLCKQKLDKIKAFKEARQHSEFRVPQRPARPRVPRFAAEEETSSATDAGEEETSATASAPSRGRVRTRGSRARTVSPLMIPVLWGFGADAPTSLLPSQVLKAHSGGRGAIIRRSTPDAHPVWRLVNVDQPELKGWRPRG